MTYKLFPKLTRIFQYKEDSLVNAFAHCYPYIFWRYLSNPLNSIPNEFRSEQCPYLSICAHCDLFKYTLEEHMSNTIVFIKLFSNFAFSSSID